MFSRGGSRIFFRRGCTRLLLYFNTNKPHSFFLQNTSCIRKPQVISGGGAHPLHPPPRSAPVQRVSLVLSEDTAELYVHFLGTKKNLNLNIGARDFQKTCSRVLSSLIEFLNFIFIIYFLLLLLVFLFTVHYITTIPML